jgi:hypothetical protein
VTRVRAIDGANFVRNPTQEDDDNPSPIDVTLTYQEEKNDDGDHDCRDSDGKRNDSSLFSVRFLDLNLPEIGTWSAGNVAVS